jgi:hypothetical protein
MKKLILLSFTIILLLVAWLAWTLCFEATQLGGYLPALLLTFGPVIGFAAGYWIGLDEAEGDQP